MALLEILHTIDNNILALIILVIILAAASNRRDKNVIQHQLFVALVIINMLLCCLEILGWSFDARAGVTGAAARWLNLGANTLLYCFVPVPPVIWFLYAHYQIFHDGRRLRRAALILALPLLLNSLLTVASWSAGWFFSVDAANRYQRGPLFPVHVTIAIGLLLASCLMVLFNRRLLDKRSFRTLLLYVVPQLTGSALQILIYGVSLNWVAMMISVLIVYLQLQDRGLSTDALTGAYNRSHFEQIVTNRIRRIGEEQSFAVILADMDNFKRINDQFGHQTGDEALQAAVHLIRGSLRKNDLIARFGGDEFYVLLELADSTALLGAIRRIYREFEKFNLESSRPYQLELSMGGAIYDPKSNLTADQFLQMTDQLMYQEKARRRSLRRSRSL